MTKEENESKILPVQVCGTGRKKGTHRYSDAENGIYVKSQGKKARQTPASLVIIQFGESERTEGSDCWASAAPRETVPA